MNQSFYTAITGAKSFQSGINATGSNISNINTPGHRGSIVEYSTLISKHMPKRARTTSDDIGYGSGVSTTNINLKEGPIRATGNTFDLALRGEGWFGVRHKNIYDGKTTAYTRSGVFAPDKDRYLVDPNGNYLLGTYYNNISRAGDKYTINTQAQSAKPDPRVQERLFVPHNLTHPNKPTSNISLNANLQGDSKKFSAARGGDYLASLYSDKDKALNIKKGDTFVLGSDENFYARSNQLVREQIIGDEAKDGKDTQLRFKLNGKEISAHIPDGTKGADAAKIIAAALNAAGVQAEASGNKLSIKAKTEINISDSNDYKFIQNANASLATFNPDKQGTNDFASLEDLRALVERQIQKSSPESKAYIDKQGKIRVLAGGAFNFHAKAGEQGESELSKILSNLNGAYAKYSQKSSLGLYALSMSANTKVITASDDANEAALEFRKNDKNPNDGVEKWTLSGKIYRKKPLEASADLGETVYSNTKVSLSKGDDFWVKGGQADLIKNGGSYYYKLAVQDEITDGRKSNYTFSVNGKRIHYEAADGAKKEEIAAGILGELKKSGIEGEIDSTGAVLIKPQDGRLTVKNAGSSELVQIKDAALMRLSYGQNFTSAADLVQKANEALSEIGLEMGLENSKFTVKNKSALENTFNLLDGYATNKHFLESIGLLQGTISPSAQNSSNSIEYNEILSSAERELDFNAENGSLLGETKFDFLQNGDKPVTLNLNTAISSTANKAHDNSITQDGVLSGTLKGYTVEKDGEIFANFSNGQSTAIGRVSVFHFINDGGLERLGANLFKESQNSGRASFYYDKDGNVIYSSVVQSKNLEESNVSTALAMSDLIVYQRSFQSAAKVITTSDQMIEKAIGLKR
ncbi:MAG: flagellar hook-basal body complex protein [Helicobacteraceae bacterium]